MNPELLALVNAMSPDIYRNLKQAVETGRWPDGKLVTDEQRENALQGVIAYEQLHAKDEDKTGYMPSKPGACGTEASKPIDTPLRWKE